MAATVSSAWAKPGAWALDSEQHEEELKQELQTPTAAAPTTDFPSLAAAITTKPSKKKSKGQTLSLAEFSSYKPPSATEQPIVLPTGPRERTQEELEQSRSRGFRGFSDRGDRDRDSRTRAPREDRDLGPSRADEVDDWSKTKKAPSSFVDSGRDRDMGPSRADEVDDWSKGKKFGGGGGGGGGGERRERERVGGFFNSSRADEVDNWAANKSFAPSEQRRERRVGFDATGPASDADNWTKNKAAPENGISGAAGGGGRPRLNLQPRTLPVEKIVVKIDEVVTKEVEREEEVPVVVTERKPKANPFGAARPREEVLKEKGQDWKEIDEKLEAVKLKEVERSNGGGESFGSGRRRGFGLGSGEERSVRTWRKPDSPNGRPAAAAPSTPSAETAEKSAEVTENSESNEEVPEAN